MILAADETSQARTNILVVEDEILVRVIIADHLRDAGYVVVEAGGADEALEYLSTSNDVRLVFSDVRMPGSMDGLEFARQVRRLFPNMPIILASGHLLTGDADDIPLFSKPYRLDAVTAKIRALLGAAEHGA